MIRALALLPLVALAACSEPDYGPRPDAEALHDLAKCEWASANRSHGTDFRRPCARAVVALKGSCRAYAIGLRDDDTRGMVYWPECKLQVGEVEPAAIH